MPSKFLIEQAELLYNIKDAEAVLNNLRDKYKTSSFPSQMSRTKQIWFGFEDRHSDFAKNFKKAYTNAQAVISDKKAVKEMKEFGRDTLDIQVKKKRSAGSVSGLTGNESIDSVISEIRLLPKYMDSYRLSDTDKMVSSDMAKKSLEDRSMDCVEIDDPDDLLKRCKSIIRNLKEDPFITSAAISIVCGRRSIEILKTGKFAASEKRGSMACLFSGAAKKKVIHECYEDIPLLMKYKYLNRAINYIRENIPCDNLTNAQINSKYSHKLGDASKILTNQLGVRFHDMRCLYGNMSFNMYENNCSINVWLKKSLLHESLDISVHYSRCKMSPCETKLGRWDY